MAQHVHSIQIGSASRTWWYYWEIERTSKYRRVRVSLISWTKQPKTISR